MKDGDYDLAKILEADGTTNKNPEEDFQCLDKLGEGSFGSVWKALHRTTGQIVAIKRVPVDDDLDELIGEIDFMKTLRSPHIIQYYKSYWKSGELWIVMEYCGAGSCCDIMKITESLLNEDQIAYVTKQTLLGLEYLHKERKIHRDVKAGNVLLTEKGDVKLADFGVSGQISDNMAKRKTVTGTPFWMAPEVIQEVGYDFKADIWSLGITVIELALGAPPYSEMHPMRAIFMIPSKPPPTLEDNDEVSWTPHMKDFLAKALTKDPDARPTATQLLQHPWIKSAPGAVCLKELLEYQEARITEFGREKLLELDPADEEEEDEKRPTYDSDSDSGDGYSTVNVVDMERERAQTQSITGRVPEGYVPQFLQKAPATETNKYQSMSTDKLKQLAAELDAKLDQEITQIKQKFQKEKAVVAKTIEEKKLALQGKKPAQ